MPVYELKVLSKRYNNMFAPARFQYFLAKQIIFFIILILISRDLLLFLEPFIKKKKKHLRNKLHIVLQKNNPQKY